MTGIQHSRGAPSGRDPLAADAIRCLRLWTGGPDGQQALYRDFLCGLGPQQARHAAACLEDLCALCAYRDGRTAVDDAPGCLCLGCDDCRFAEFVAAAGRCDRERALMLACTMVRPDLAPGLVGLAQALGLALMRLSLRKRRMGGAGTPLDSNQT